MRSDGRVLPDLTQTLVLNRLCLIRSDELPYLAARWLAAGMTDTESTRMFSVRRHPDRANGSKAPAAVGRLRLLPAGVRYVARHD